MTPLAAAANATLKISVGKCSSATYCDTMAYCTTHLYYLLHLYAFTLHHLRYTEPHFIKSHEQYHAYHIQHHTMSLSLNKGKWSTRREALESYDHI